MESLSGKKVLIISESLKGKGGVISVVKTYEKYYNSFNHVSSTSQKNIFHKIFTFFCCFVRVFYYLSFKDIQIVHIHTASYGSFFRKSILVNFIKLWNKYIILHIHGAGFKDFYKKNNVFNFIPKTLNKVDTIIVLSKSWQTYFSKITKSRIIILENIVDAPKSITKEQYIEGRKIHFLYLGIIGDRKGIFDLLKLLKDHKDEFQDKVILHIGGNGEIDRLNKYIEENKLQDIVIYEGWVSGEQKEHLLQQSNIYILPSYNEGLPISILEAMSYKMPIISTEVGGIPEVVFNGENGFLSAPGDLSKLYQAINYFVQYPDMIEEMGNKSFKIVQPHFANSVIAKLNTIYEDLVKK